MTARRAWGATLLGCLCGMAALVLALLTAITAETGPPSRTLVAAACAIGIAGVASTAWGHVAQRRLLARGAGSAEACTIAGALCLFAAGAAVFPFLFLAIVGGDAAR